MTHELDNTADPSAGQAASPDALTFLRWLYGDDAPGWLTISTFDSQPTQWFPAHQLDRVTIYCQAIARRYNAYFGLGLRQEQLEDGRGESSDVLGIPGFWIEIDFKHTVHTKVNLPETIEESIALVHEALPLEPSLIIRSGYGIHVYWLFRELWIFEDTEDRQAAYHLLHRLQATVQAVAKLHGWEVDSTFDLARVLRMPGTYNRKIPDTPQLVEIIDAHEHQRYNPSDFSEHLIEVDTTTYRQTTSEAHTGDLPAIELHTIKIPTWLRALIRYGEDVNAAKSYPSRSEALFDAVQGLIKAGVDDQTSMSLLLDSRHAVSEKPREKGRKWLASEIARARGKLNGHRPTATSTPELETSETESEGHHIGANGDEQDIPQADVTLETVVETFREWLDLPDAGFIEVLLATYAANQIPGDPVWLLAVGPSSGGKTEPLQAMLGLPHTKLASTLTESALLSGTPKRDKDKSSTGGLLREIGDFGYLILKDFTSVLAMQDKIRMTTVAALREIYDQSWARPLGIDGGRVLSWKGKIAILAGCTDVIDSHHILMTAMGSRFLMYRIPLIDAYAQASKAYDMTARESEMRQQLRRVITGFFRGRDFSKVRPTPSEGIREHLIQLSILAVVARSPIERDRHTREITLIPDPEAPARVTKALGKLYAALRAVGVPAPRAWALVRKIALDSMPKLRCALINALSKNGLQAASDLAIAIHHPTQTTKRALEDLAGLKLVEREKIKGVRGDRWSLTEETRIRLQQLPENIENDDVDEL